jgi:GntR family transcriptional regulator, transcriptional repressor for pyruvate dehydrogenase complex
VTRTDDVLVVATPDFVGAPTPKLLGDLTRTRLLLEMQAARDAATRATAEHLREMRRLLRAAAQSLDNDDVFHAIDGAFHRQLAVASGNAVLAQLLAVLGDLFPDEQRAAQPASRAQAHQEHLGILAALEQCAPALVAERVAAHFARARPA